VARLGARVWFFRRAVFGWPCSACIGGERSEPRPILLLTAIALPLVRENKPSWLRTIGKKIAPEVKASGSG
jgi:hypothetical protein